MVVLGNRGKCAQPCRLPYELLDSSGKSIDKGHLLSPRDLCGIEYLPKLVKTGIKCLKVEGRLKSPEYVATVTRVYRKYLNMAINNMNEKTAEYTDDQWSPLQNPDTNILLKDKQQLMQVFNRGGFSHGHLSAEPNTNLIYKQKPNHMGLTLGKIISYNPKKGYIKLKLENSISIGDSIQVEKENNNYNVSELLLNGSNIKTANIGDIVEIGRLKGNISVNDKVFKTVDKSLSLDAKKTFNGTEYKKISIDGTITIKQNSPILFNVTCKTGIYNGCNINLESNIFPEAAEKSPVTKDKIIAQLTKTGNTEFEFSNLTVNLDDNLFIPNIALNDLRRSAIEKLEEYAKEEYKRTLSLLCEADEQCSPLQKGSHAMPGLDNLVPLIQGGCRKATEGSVQKYCALLNNLNLDTDYSGLGLDRVYIPFKYFINQDYQNLLNTLCNLYNVYIYIPTIIRNNYLKSISKLDNIITTYNIKGFVISHISQLEFVNIYNLDIIGNYTLNVMNLNTASFLEKLGLNTITISPELDKLTIIDMLNNSKNTNFELIVYGKLPLMTSNYCLIGHTNHCLSTCNKNCEKQFFYLKDRLGLLFKIVPDNIDTVTTIYNSKITSISHNEFNLSYVRMDFLDENIDEIKNVIDTVKNGNRLEGKDYTNGNINRLV